MTFQHPYHALTVVGLYLSRWLASLYCVDAGNWTSEEAEIVVTVETMLREVDMSPDSQSKAVHIQLVYVWSDMFKEAGQNGIAYNLVKSVQIYIDNC